MLLHFVRNWEIRNKNGLCGRVSEIDLTGAIALTDFVGADRQMLQAILRLLEKKYFPKMLSGQITVKEV